MILSKRLKAQKKDSVKFKSQMTTKSIIWVAINQSKSSKKSS